MPHCDSCGAHTYLPFTCSYCGGNYCGKCRLPPNHRCTNLDSWEGKPRPPYPTRGWGNYERYEGTKTRQYPETNHKEREPRKKVSIKIQNLLNLKNLTTLSVTLIAVGLFSQQYLITQYAEIFEIVIIVGVLGFLVSYFIYSLKCWGTNSQISAVFMITIPLLAYFFSISKIPESANVAIYIFIIFCIFAIISTIFLFLFNKIKLGIENCIFNTKRRYHHYFHLKTSYSLIGIVVISFLLINYGSVEVFSDNAATITQSFQNTNSHAYTTSSIDAVPTSTILPTTQIVATLQKESVKKIEDTADNSHPSIDIPTLEKRIHDLINQQRRGNGISTLSYDTSLASIARKHSADMAKNNYFSHNNLQGLNPTDRGNQVSYSCYKNYGSYYTTGIAENIFQTSQTTTYNGIMVHDVISMEEIAQSTVSGWMNSPGHRQNILTSTYDREGIGVAIASDNKVYVTEDFC